IGDDLTLPGAIRGGRAVSESVRDWRLQRCDTLHMCVAIVRDVSAIANRGSSRTIPTRAAEIAPGRLLDSARAAAAATARHPEDEGGDEGEDKEEDDSDFEDQSDDAVEHPAEDQSDHETGEESA